MKSLELLRAALGCAAALAIAALPARPASVPAPALRPHASPAFAVATAPYVFKWPRDHASHPGYQTEWWYFTGHVTTTSGRRFGYELTFFRFGLRPGDPPPAARESKWRGHELYPAHFAITDEAGKTFFYDVRFAREALNMGGASATSLDVHADDWTLRGEPIAGKPSLERMELHARDDDSRGREEIDLVQSPEKPPAVHGHDGVSRKADCASCASHYYSYTRLRTSGTLVFAGRRFAVDGLSWMDHEFGSAELRSDQAGWDWFSLQLDDRREVMLYLLRQKDGSVTAESSGSLIEPDGGVRYLARDAFSVAATGVWKSPHTGASYPNGWRVLVPSAKINVTLEPTVDDQELAVTAGGVSYWEGSVAAADPATGKALGIGYVELTGYAQAISL
jgi:predicted secreted hydrolase